MQIYFNIEGNHYFAIIYLLVNLFLIKMEILIVLL